MSEPTPAEVEAAFRLLREQFFREDADEADAARRQREAASHRDDEHVRHEPGE